MTDRITTVHGHWRKNPKSGKPTWVREHVRKITGTNKTKTHSEERSPDPDYNAPPKPGAIKMKTGKSAYGKTEGVHTGGPWLVGNEVWKPLDAKPYMNAPKRYPTNEADVLADMAGTDLFPQNWRVEESNGRKWLVRPKSVVWGEDKEGEGVEYPLDMLPDKMAYRVENAIAELNKHGWTIGDDIILATDPKGQYFILDLSAAHRQFNSNDEWRVEQFWKAAGYDNLVNMRIQGGKALSDLWVKQMSTKYRYAYASYNRPISRMWARLPDDAELVDTGGANWQKMIPHTWIFTKTPLPEDTLYNYELKLAYKAPIGGIEL